MSRIELNNQTPDNKGSELTPERVCAVHQALSAEERKDLAYLRVVRNNDSLPGLEMKFKNRNVCITGTDKSVAIKGDFNDKDIASALRVVASLGWTDVCADTDEADKQKIWALAKDEGINVSNIQPDARTRASYEKDLDKLAPIAEFFAKSKEITVHDGVNRNEAKPSPAARFLKKVMRQPKKIFNALKFAAKKVGKVVSDIYDFNEKPAVKVAATLGAAFIGSIVVGKALYNAHLLQDAAKFLKSDKKEPKLTLSAKERKEKLADTLVKSAVFTTVAALGQGYFDPSAIPGVSIGPTRWTGVDKMRKLKNYLKKSPVEDLPYVLAKKEKTKLKIIP